MLSECSGESTDSSCEDERQRKNSCGRKTNAIVTRTNASAGYWLCCLLPAALATRYMRNFTIKCDNVNVSFAAFISFNSSSSSGAGAGTANATNPADSISASSMLAVAALGMCVESLCFFAYMCLETSLLLKLLISFVPGLLTTALYCLLLQQSWAFGIFWGFAVTFCYQNAYIRVMRGLPRCFTYGEATVLVQGIMLFVLNVVLQLPNAVVALLSAAPSKAVSEFAQLNAIMMSALFFLLVVCWLLATFPLLRQPLAFYSLLALLVVAVTCIPITRPLPVVMLYHFIVKDKMRLKIVGLCLTLVGLTIATIWWQLRRRRLSSSLGQSHHSQKASTSVRKIFHLLIVLVYVPGLLYQCAFLYIASGVALAIFTVLEVFRLLEMPPPLASVLKDAFAAFSDEKDAGALALTPFCLLIGCSLPIWISPCPCGEVAARRSALLPLLAGILAVGLGDTAASVVGSLFGSLKWRNSTRTLEGTVAFVAASLSAVYYLALTGHIPMTSFSWLTTIAAILVTALVEAHTDQIDNLVLPLLFYTIVSLA